MALPSTSAAQWLMLLPLTLAAVIKAAWTLGGTRGISLPEQGLWAGLPVSHSISFCSWRYTFLYWRENLSRFRKAENKVVHSEVITSIKLERLTYGRGESL